MKGIKTAVKTDWKNYASGNSRGPIDITKSSAYFHGFAKGDTVYLSYHVRWKGVDWGKWIDRSCFQGSSDLAWYEFGPENKGISEGEQDVRVSYLIENPGWTHIAKPTTAETLLYIYSHVGDGGIKVADDGYIEITNFMVSEGCFMPYIDSDELKAEGGAISKALIVALVLSEERRAA